MARIRSVKPELRTSLTVAEWDREVRYFWVLIWGYLDDEGRGLDEPRLIKADCFPLDDDLTATDIDAWIDVIATPREGDDEPGALCRYKVGTRRYVHAPKWRDSQKPQHPKVSKIPPCPKCGDASGRPPEDITKVSGGLFEDLENPSSPAGEQETAKATTGKQPKDADVREDVLRLCEHLADRVKANGSKRPNITKRWLDAARLMLDADGRTEEQVSKAIDWCQADEFWRANVMSMPKLRDKYDQLRLQATKQTNGNGSQAAPGSGQRNLPDPSDYGKGKARI